MSNWWRNSMKYMFSYRQCMHLVNHGYRTTFSYTWKYGVLCTLASNYKNYDQGKPQVFWSKNIILLVLYKKFLQPSKLTYETNKQNKHLPVLLFKHEMFNIKLLPNHSLRRESGSLPGYWNPFILAPFHTSSKLS